MEQLQDLSECLRTAEDDPAKDHVGARKYFERPQGRRNGNRLCPLKTQIQEFSFSSHVGSAQEGERPKGAPVSQENRERGSGGQLKREREGFHVKDESSGLQMMLR